VPQPGAHIEQQRKGVEDEGHIAAGDKPAGGRQGCESRPRTAPETSGGGGGGRGQLRRRTVAPLRPIHA
jgi:hypothetical protein